MLGAQRRAARAQPSHATRAGRGGPPRAAIGRARARGRRSEGARRRPRAATAPLVILEGPCLPAGARPLAIGPLTPPPANPSGARLHCLRPRPQSARPRRLPLPDPLPSPAAAPPCCCRSPLPRAAPLAARGDAARGSHLVVSGHPLRLHREQIWAARSHLCCCLVPWTAPAAASEPRSAGSEGGGWPARRRAAEGLRPAAGGPGTQGSAVCWALRLQGVPELRPAPCAGARLVLRGRSPAPRPRAGLQGLRPQRPRPQETPRPPSACDPPGRVCGPGVVLRPPLVSRRLRRAAPARVDGHPRVPRAQCSTRPARAAAGAARGRP